MKTITKLFTSGIGIKKVQNRYRKGTKVYRLKTVSKDSISSGTFTKSQLNKIYGIKKANMLIRKRRIIE